MNREEDLFTKGMVGVGSVGGDKSSKAMTLKEGLV